MINMNMNDEYEVINQKTKQITLNFSFWEKQGGGPLCQVLRVFI